MAPKSLSFSSFLHSFLIITTINSIYRSTLQNMMLRSYNMTRSLYYLDIVTPNRFSFGLYGFNGIVPLWMKPLFMKSFLLIWLMFFSIMDCFIESFQFFFPFFLEAHHILLVFCLRIIFIEIILKFDDHSFSMALLLSFEKCWNMRFD